MKFFKNTFNDAYARQGNLRYWDQQWNFTCWSQNGLGIRPYTNLVEYIGFDDGTHTRGTWGGKQLFELPASEMELPLRHPAYLVRNREADQFNYDRVVGEMERSKRRRRYQRIKSKFAEVIGVTALGSSGKPEN